MSSGGERRRAASASVVEMGKPALVIYVCTVSSFVGVGFDLDRANGSRVDESRWTLKTASRDE
jgi:hypothetical protein